MTWYPPEGLTPAKIKKAAQAEADTWKRELKQAFLMEQETTQEKLALLPCVLLIQPGKPFLCLFLFYESDLFVKCFSFCHVLLHRTGGAGVGMPASAHAAEVFFLTPAAYLWAYNQSANLSQAYLTYVREVAPRF